MNIMYFHKLSHFFLKKNIPIIPKIIYYVQFMVFNSSVPPEVLIGKGTKAAYGGIGIVIHSRAKIGCDCLVGQGVTIGGRSKMNDVPVIGDRVYVGAGARILGNVIIGDDVVIGANSVVIHDIPSKTVVVGAPARVIKSDIEPSDFF